MEGLFIFWGYLSHSLPRFGLRCFPLRGIAPHASQQAHTATKNPNPNRNTATKEKPRERQKQRPQSQQPNNRSRTTPAAHDGQHTSPTPGGLRLILIRLYSNPGAVHAQQKSHPRRAARAVLFILFQNFTKYNKRKYQKADYKKHIFFTPLNHCKTLVCCRGAVLGE